MSISPYQHFVGIDIAARTADVALLSAQGDVLGNLTIEQSSAGYRHLLEVLTRLSAIPEQTLVVMEATGTYWMKLAFWLYEAGFVVSVVNPVQTHPFAQLHLQRAKTDQIDAPLIAQFAWLHQPIAWTPPPPVYHALQQHLVQRDAFLLMRTQMKNQLHALQQQHDISPLVVARYQDQVDQLSQQIAAIEVALEALLRQDPTWAVSYQRLRSIPGVGVVTAAWILTATLNFTQCATAEQAAAYAGLVPHPRHSGTNQHRHTGVGNGGHARLRTALYMATLSAAQHNPVVRTFYRRLLQQGKARKVARCAAARKLLHIAWAVVTKRQFFDPFYEQRTFLAKASA